MASLFCNPTSGFFYAQFYSSRHKPSRKTVPLRTSTKRVAERALSRLVDAYALGEYDPWVSLEVVEQLETVREGVDAYLNACNHLKPNTIRTYREIFGAFMRFVGPDFRLSKITVSRIEAWLQTTSTNDVTKRKYVRHLGYIFRFLVSRGEMDLDLSKLVPLRKIPEMAPKSMTREETERLLATIRRYANSSSCRRNVEWLADLVELNVHVGLRRGELLHLKWAHVDCNRHVLMVKNTNEFTTKSSKERAIPLGENAKLVLLKLRDQANGPFVFHDDGTQLKAGTLSKAFQKFRCMSGLPPHINLHSTRHTFGTWLAEKGVPVTVIQSLMGHGSVTTTERYMSTRADVAEQWVSRAFSS